MWKSVENVDVVMGQQKKSSGDIEFELEFDKSKLTQIRIVQLINAGLV